MPRIVVHGGDFPQSAGAWQSDLGFYLIDVTGAPETIPPDQLTMADHASEITLGIAGASAATRAQFEQATVPPGHVMFVAVFGDGRMLLASTDQQTFECICAPRAGDDHGKENSEPR